MSNSGRIIVSKEGGRLTEVVNSTSDPGMWIVREWHRSILGRRLTLSRWFNDAEQALSFARGLAGNGGSPTA